MTAQLLSPHIREAHVFPNISWQQFEAIDQAFNSVPGVKFRYLDGALEIMPISEEHEDFKTILRMLLEAYLRSQRIRFYGCGGPSPWEPAANRTSPTTLAIVNPILT